MGASPQSPNDPRRAGRWPPYSLLGCLPPDARADLLRRGTEERFGSAQTMLVEGSRDTRDVYVLLSGAVKVVSNTATGTAVLLAIRSDGDLLGELAALDGRPRLAGVITIRPCLVRRIGQDAFLSWLTTYPYASLAVNRSVSVKLRNTTWHRVEFSGSPVPLRLARLLIQLAIQHGDPDPEGTAIQLSLTQADLAGLAGAQVPTVQKALRALRRDGVVSCGYRRIVVRDWEALHAIAGIAEIPPEYGTALDSSDGQSTYDSGHKEGR